MELQTPNTVPVIEKSISPLEPIMKPKTTMHRVTMTGKEVVVCKRTKLGANKGKKEKKYVKITLKRIVKERATR